MSPTPTDLTATDAARRIRDGELSPVELTRACLARIDDGDARIRAWIHVAREDALALAAEREDEARAGGIRGPLHGVPVGIKDIIHVAAMPTTAGAGRFAHEQPALDAPVVTRLRAAGAVVLGKTATTEFAFSDPAETRNPWNEAHTPGGSSSGSAAAVAARMVPLALGSQTVGSVLRPAAYCGVVGIKGTHGLVPAEGVIPLAWSLDHVGGFARSVADAALLLGVMADRAIAAAPATPRIGISADWIGRATPDVATHVFAMAETFRRAGAAVEDVALPKSIDELDAVGRTVLRAEAALYHHDRFGGVSGHRAGLAELIRAGLALPAVDYVRANRARAAFRAAMGPLLEGHDVLLTPVAPSPAPPGLTSTGDPMFCGPWSFIGVPSISLPSAVGASGLPLAIQLVAAAGREDRLFAAAAWCERVLDFRASPPGSSAPARA
jgi:Asp-tRNA(Asn)/Glu-tRNA(Gln) amidotransferase A subunit family amidase